MSEHYDVDEWMRKCYDQMLRGDSPDVIRPLVAFACLEANKIEMFEYPASDDEAVRKMICEAAIAALHDAAGLPAPGGGEGGCQAGNAADSCCHTSGSKSPASPPPVRWRCETCRAEWDGEVETGPHRVFQGDRVTICPGPVVPVTKDGGSGGSCLPDSPGHCPIPCLVCGKQLEEALPGMPEGTNQPYAALAFTTNGHYGSTLFDRMDDATLEINVCEPCLVERKGRVFTAPNRGSILRPWVVPVTKETP